MSYLGLDIGTTGCKAAVFDQEGRMLALAYREYPLLSPQPGWALNGRMGGRPNRGPPLGRSGTRRRR